jgi:hypothetical protein
MSPKAAASPRRPRKGSRRRERIVELPSPLARALEVMPPDDQKKAIAHVRGLEQRAFSKPSTPDSFEALRELVRLTTRPLILEEDA